MAIEKGKLQLEKYKYDKFMKEFTKGKFGAQRLGQAFYDYFKLDRLDDQTQLKNLYSKDGDQAKNLIREIFKFN